MPTFSTVSVESGPQFAQACRATVRQANTPISCSWGLEVRHRGFRRVLCAFVLAALVCASALVATTTPAYRAHFRPPAGPIAERLASVAHGPGKRAETSALKDLFPAGTKLFSGGKGPRGQVRNALKAARFDCSRAEPTRESTGLLVCRNDAAGYTADGCRRDWLIVLELPQLTAGSASADHMRTFVRARC